MAERKWTADEIPSLRGELVVITGSNSGIGYEAAKVLADKGAHVIIAVRSAQRGDAAAAMIRQSSPAAKVTVMPLDLADLSSVHTFAETFLNEHASLSLLINNAGVMAIPYQKTKDGFEMQFGTNHLGHFALTGLLLPALVNTPKSRVVAVSSMAHSGGHIDFDNLDGARGYRRWRAYAQSKLANLLFAYELQRRLVKSGAETICVACHPGFAATNLVASGMQGTSLLLSKATAGMTRLMAQSAAMGALPTLYAATAPHLQGGEYIGPGGPNNMRGYPKVVTSNRESHNEDVAKRLWDVSENLTGVHYEALGEL